MLATTGADSGASSALSRCSYSQVTSAPVSSSSVAANSSSPPGRTRPSTYPTASPGITLILSPACSMVGLALLRIVPATSAAAGPSRASSSSALKPSIELNGTGCAHAPAMPSIAARTVGIALTGQRCVPILATAAPSRVTAFSG
jgi:hypothetical protein